MTLAADPRRRRPHTWTPRGFCRHCSARRADADDGEECAVRLRAALDELVARIVLEKAS